MSRWMCICATVALAVTTACSTRHYRESADRDVYRILEQKQQKALGRSAPFSIEPAVPADIAALPVATQPLAGSDAPVAEGGTAIEPAPLHVLSLSKALEISLLNSRTFQSRKEDTYLTALALTLERNKWTPIFSGILSGKREWSDGDETWAGDSRFGVTQLISTGARISLSVTSDFVRHITGDPRTTAFSTLSAEIVQPLWRGAGARIAQENLRQSERNAIYSVRSFVQFNRDFVVDIATSYFGLLQQRDSVRNEWQNYRRLIVSRERAHMLAQAGRLPEFQVDQAEQDELSARDRWVRSLQTYQQLLDQFKFTLAMPTDADVDVDEAELQRLVEAGIIHPEIGADAAVRQALALRLDLMNARDAVDDAQRKVEVAINGLGPDVNLVLDAGVPTESGRPTAFRFDRGSYGAGLDLTLPLERTAERNTYRQALVNLERARRAAQSSEDSVKLEVRQAWRNLQEARETYEIQIKSLALAQRRVDSTTLLLQAGRANTRDLLESQAALLSAQNAVTRARVSHAIARLQLWRDMGTLSVTPEGRIEEERRESAEKSNPS